MNINIHKWMKTRLTQIQSQIRTVCKYKQKKESGLSRCNLLWTSGWLINNLKNGFQKELWKKTKPQPYCKYCQKFVTCSKTSLKRHSTSNIHHKNTKDTSAAGTLTRYFTKSATRDETSSMEIKLCAFIAEHNLPISLSDDFLAQIHVPT